MRAFFEGLALNFGYFTRLPMPWHIEKVHEAHYRYLALTLPLTGLLLAGVTLLLFMLLAPCAESWFVALLVAVGYHFMYGFLHLEGVGDIADAAYGGHGGKGRHEIVKDPHIGAIGVMWVVALMLLKVAAMVLLLLHNAFVMLLLVPMFSRFCALLLLRYAPLHAQSHFARKMQHALQKWDAAWVVAALALLALWAGTFWMVPVTLAATYTLYRYLKRQIGFVNGDGMGFTIEMTETVLLCAAVFVVT